MDVIELLARSDVDNIHEGKVISGHVEYLKTFSFYSIDDDQTQFASLAYRVCGKNIFDESFFLNCFANELVKDRNELII